MGHLVVDMPTVHGMWCMFQNCWWHVAHVSALLVARETVGSPVIQPRRAAGLLQGFEKAPLWAAAHVSALLVAGGTCLSIVGGKGNSGITCEPVKKCCWAASRL